MARTCARRSVRMSRLRKASSPRWNTDRLRRPRCWSIIHRCTSSIERKFGCCTVWNGSSCLLADRVAVVAVDQDVAPQHQRIAAAFGEDAALQRLVLLRRHRLDIGLEFLVDDDVHAARTQPCKTGAHCRDCARVVLPCISARCVYSCAAAQHARRATQPPSVLPLRSICPRSPASPPHPAPRRAHPASAPAGHCACHRSCRPCDRWRSNEPARGYPARSRLRS